MSSEKIKLFQEIDYVLQNDNKPSLYIERISKTSAFKVSPFHMLDVLKQTPQSPKHHPEGNVWNHTMLVLDMAAEVKSKSKNPRTMMWAALLHDIGKPGTTRVLKDRIISYDHDKLGEELSLKFLSELTNEIDFIQSVTSLVRWHMQIMFVAKDMPYADIGSMKKDTDVREIALLGLCDRLGRLNPDKNEEEENIKIFMEKCGI